MKRFMIILIFVSFGILMLSLTASALQIEYPLPFLKGNTSPTPCEYIRALYIWGLTIVGAVAVTSLAIGGFLYMTGQAQKGKDYLLSTFLGLLLLLGSWLILNTINPDLAKLKCDLPALTTSPSATASPSASPSATPTLTPTPTPTLTPTPTPTGSSDQQVRDQLSAAGLSINKTCSDPNATTCKDQTCLNGLQQTSIDGIKNIKSSCNCSITITGGTEGGCHTGGLNSHKSGKKLDIRPASGIDSYVTQQGCGKSPQDTNCKGKDGNTYRYETDGGAHWDVCFGC